MSSRPAVGGCDGAVEGVVGVGEPARALVVEIGERALLQLDRRFNGLGQDAVRMAPRRLPRRRGSESLRAQLCEKSEGPKPYRATRRHVVGARPTMRNVAVAPLARQFARA